MREDFGDAFGDINLFYCHRFFHTGGDVAPSVDIKLNKTLTYKDIGSFKNTDYKELLSKK